MAALIVDSPLLASYGGHPPCAAALNPCLSRERPVVAQGGRLRPKESAKRASDIEGAQMLKRVLALIGVGWGGAVVVYGLTHRAPAAATAYAAGQISGMITGGIVCVLCLIFLVNGGKPKDKS
jgi:hypothetical protein